MKTQACIRRAQSCKTEAREAVREFYAAVRQPDMALVLFFCSSAYDLAAVAAEMAALFAGVQVIGCTTAGEIGPAGCQAHSLSGASFPSSRFDVVSGHMAHLQDFEMTTGQAVAQDLLQRLQSQAPQAGSGNTFALLLIDGLSVREEPVTWALQRTLGGLPLVGGSAGDGLDFDRTHVYFGGQFHADSAVLALVSTPLPFRLFKTQHFVATAQRMVVTEADTAHRTVSEINGLPAAQEYAHLLGLDAGDLDPQRFASWPVVVMIDGMSYVRSIQQVNADNSLTFFCAIENGLVLRVAQGVDLLQNLTQTLAQLGAEIGPPQLVLVCDCILRKIEAVQGGLGAQVSELFRQHRTVGFNTYGEQFHGVHVNQTLVGVAIGGEALETGDA